MSIKPAGHRADDPEFHRAINELATLLGASLRSIHEGEIDPEAKLVGWNALAARIEAQDGATDEFPEPFCRYDRPRLIELWRAGRPKTEDLVPSHGEARLGNLMVLDGEVSGWVGGIDSLVVDRHLDLAFAHRSVASVLGNEAIYALYEAYGMDPYLPTLEHYLLAELLLG